MTDDGGIDGRLLRRKFVAIVVAACVATMWRPASLTAFGRRSRAVADVDPEPRPGVDASHVLTNEQLKDSPGAIKAFEQVRQIPQIVDGIRCHCGCADAKGNYSLLSCYETENGMAAGCQICQGQAKMAFRLNGEGKSLAEIRAAIHARYD